jgi:hypothetical protein
MAVARIWDADNGVWQIIGEGQAHVVDPTEPPNPIDGMLWTNPSDVTVGDVATPKGVLGYAQVVANQAGMGVALADLTGLAVTVTVAANRRIRISGKCAFISTDAVFGNHIWRLTFREGSTIFQEIHRPLVNSGNIQSIEGSVILTPSAGVHTFKLSALQTNNAAASSMVASGTMPAFILVEDIGAA